MDYYVPRRRISAALMREWSASTAEGLCKSRRRQHEHLHARMVQQEYAHVPMHRCVIISSSSIIIIIVIVIIIIII